MQNKKILNKYEYYISIIGMHITNILMYLLLNMTYASSSDEMWSREWLTGVEQKEELETGHLPAVHLQHPQPRCKLLTSLDQTGQCCLSLWQNWGHFNLQEYGKRNFFVISSFSCFCAPELLFGLIYRKALTSEIWSRPVTATNLAVR